MLHYKLVTGKGHERATQVAMRLTTQLGLNEKERLGKLLTGSDNSSRVGESGKDVLGKGSIMSKYNVAWNSVIYLGNCMKLSDSQKDACVRITKHKFGAIGREWVKMTLQHVINH